MSNNISILSKYELKYIYPFLDLKSLNNFTETNKKNNKEVNKYIKIRIKYDILDKYKKLNKYKDNLLKDYEITHKLINYNKTEIIKYLRYYNKDNKTIIKILDKHNEYKNIYCNTNILNLINLFCIKNNKDSIKKYCRYKLKYFLNIVNAELNDSVTDRLGLSIYFINSIYFYINIYKNKKIYNEIGSMKYINPWIYNSWKYVYDIINKALFTDN